MTRTEMQNRLGAVRRSLENVQRYEPLHPGYTHVEPRAPQSEHTQKRSTAAPIIVELWSAVTDLEKVVNELVEREGNEDR